MPFLTTESYTGKGLWGCAKRTFTRAKRGVDAGKNREYYKRMLQRAVLQIAGAFVGLWVATRFLENVSFTGSLLVLGQAALVLGVANAFLKPVLNLLTLPIRILTLGLSSLIINVAFVWLLDIIFPELVISGIVPLLETTIIVWILSTILSVSKR